jgi:hypothetical protein
MAFGQGALLKFEAISDEDIGPDKVAGEHIGYHLNPPEYPSHGRSHGRHQERLRQSRNTLKQDVAIGKEGHHDATDQGLLPHNNLLYLGRETLDLIDAFMEA